MLRYNFTEMLSKIGLGQGRPCFIFPEPWQYLMGPQVQGSRSDQIICHNLQIFRPNSDSDLPIADQARAVVTGESVPDSDKMGPVSCKPVPVQCYFITFNLCNLSIYLANGSQKSQISFFCFHVIGKFLILHNKNFEPIL